MKALRAAGLIEGELDWEALDTYFQLGYIPAPSTPFRGIKKLDPGHTLLWRESGEISVQRYWDLPEEGTESPRNLEQRVLEWLDDSVAAHMVSDVPVAAFLSGGLDSSAVVTSMTMHGERPHAFTARYTGSGAAGIDESHLAANLAARYGAKLTVVDIQPDVSAILEDIVYALDEPHADDSAIPTWALSQAVGSSYKVALTGIGGDELFAGYWRHIGVLLGQAYSRVPAPFRRAAAAVAGAMREPENGGLGLDRAKRFLRTADADFPDRFLSYISPMSARVRQSLYAPEIQHRAGSESGRARVRNLFLRGGCRGGLSGGLYLDYKTFLPDDVLALSDRIAMAHSLEIRVPLVDHKLVEQIFRLPDRSKVRWFVKKLLLRRALKTRLSREHLRAPKRGFVGPTASWLRGELKPMLQDELSARRLDRMGYFNATAMSQLMGEHFERRQNHERVLWAMLCFSTWHRLYVENPAPRRYQPLGRQGIRAA
jgi:asparagine synthase (glutamine-hydrolysing)